MLFIVGASKILFKAFELKMFSPDLMLMLMKMKIEIERDRERATLVEVHLTRAGDYHRGQI